MELSSNYAAVLALVSFILGFVWCKYLVDKVKTISDPEKDNERFVGEQVARASQFVEDTFDEAIQKRVSSLTTAMIETGADVLESDGVFEGLPITRSQVRPLAQEVYVAMSSTARKTLDEVYKEHAEMDRFIAGFENDHQPIIHIWKRPS